MPPAVVRDGNLTDGRTSSWPMHRRLRSGLLVPGYTASVDSREGFLGAVATMAAYSRDGGGWRA